MTGIAVGAAAIAGVAYGWWGMAATAIALAVAALTPRFRMSPLATVVVLVAALLGAWRGDSVRHPVNAAVAPDVAGLSRVVTSPERGNQYQQFVVVADATAGTGETSSRVCVIAPVLPRISLGDVLILDGGVQERADVSESARMFLRYRNCAATLFATTIEVTGNRADAGRALAEMRSALSEVLRSAAPGDAGVLLSGLVTGDDVGFSEQRAGAFIRTGTTHLTAVSGSNLALVVGMLATAGAWSVGRHRLAWQMLMVVAIWTYAAVSGLQAPVVRAALVASAAVVAFRFGRRPDFVTLILLAAGLMVIVEPQQVEALGFRLSVVSSLALAILVPPLLSGDRASMAAAAIMAAAAAQIVTLPFLLPVFGAVSLTSLPANLLAAPLVAVAMPLSALAALTGLVWPPLGELIAAPAALMAMALLAIVDWLGAPHAAIMVGTPTVTVAVVMAATVAAVLSFSRVQRK